MRIRSLLPPLAALALLASAGTVRGQAVPNEQREGRPGAPTRTYSPPGPGALPGGPLPAPPGSAPATPNLSKPPVSSPLPTAPAAPVAGAPPGAPVPAAKPPPPPAGIGTFSGLVGFLQVQTDDPAAVRLLAASLGLTVREVSGDQRVFSLVAPPGADLAILLQRLRGDPRVKSAELSALEFVAPAR